MAYNKKEIDKLFNKVCELISKKGMSLRAVLLSKDMPSSETFYKWVESDISKSKQYACACEDRSEKIFEDILNISDASKDDVIIDSEGREVVNHNVIQRDRLRVDSRKWMLGKLNPKKYSDKIQVDTTEFKEQPLFPDVYKNDSDK